MAVIIYIPEENKNNNNKFDVRDISNEEINLAIKGADKYKEACYEPESKKLMDEVIKELEELGEWKNIVTSVSYINVVGYFDHVDPSYTAKTLTRRDFYNYVRRGIDVARQKALKRWKDECRRYSELEKAVQKKIEEEA